VNIGIYTTDEEYNANNGIFNLDLYKYAPDDIAYPYILLKNELNRLGINLNTLDVYKKTNIKIDKMLFINFPTKHKKDLIEFYNQGVGLYLILYENEVIRRDNWDKNNHRYFNKIFTWNPQWANEKKYILIYLPIRIPENLDFHNLKKEKLLTVICWNKIRSHKKELYIERIRAMDWFNRYHPEDIDIYGMGWEKGVLRKFYWPFLGIPFSMRIIHLLEKIGPLHTLFRRPLKNYKGVVESKKEILGKYRFLLCYENAKDIPGYITEKIFHCFFAGCVPIYWGAPDIGKYIPENCFIDRRKFKNYEELYRFLIKMSDEDYKKYLLNIETYVKSQAIWQFSAENFVNTVIKNILS